MLEVMQVMVVVGNGDIGDGGSDGGCERMMTGVGAGEAAWFFFLMRYRLAD